MKTKTKSKVKNMRRIYLIDIYTQNAEFVKSADNEQLGDVCLRINKHLTKDIMESYERDQDWGDRWDAADTAT